jgi:hypothetical protein
MLKETPAVRGSTICLVESLPFHPQELTELRDSGIKSFCCFRGGMTYPVSLPVCEWIFRQVRGNYQSYAIIRSCILLFLSGLVSPGHLPIFSNILTDQVKTA